MDERTGAMVDRLFARFTALYGNRFTDPIDDDALWELARQEWAPVVQALTLEQIQRGLSAAKASADKWPPTFAEFVRLALDLPDTQAAAMRAARGEGDALSRLIRRETGDSYGVRRAEGDRGVRICERAYREVTRQMVDMVAAGSPVDAADLIETELESPGYALPQPTVMPARLGSGAARIGDVLPSTGGEGKS